MKNCDNYKELHKNKIGTISYCHGCKCIHAKIKGILAVLDDRQFENVLKNFSKMKEDLESKYDPYDPEIGVQISITRNMYLCLSYDDLMYAIELLEVAECLLQVDELLSA